MSGRLPPRDGEWIDRRTRFSFAFEGETVEAFDGDVITSALLASGRRTLARSFKYHRPRGVLSFANHDANVLVETEQATNIRADVSRPVPGAVYRAVNTWGGLRHDAGRVLGLFAPVLPVGFYYKAFHRPRRAFPWWEKLIRHAAGLGRLPTAGSTPRLPRRHAWCDVLVIGAGAAGLAAADELAARGATTILVDENPRPGGSLNHRDATSDEGRAFRDDLLARLEATPHVTILDEHVASACYADHCVAVVGDGGIVLVHARSVIVASGVYEQPAVFPDNDRPGVMLAGAAARLAHCYAVRPFERGVVIAGHADAYRQALALRDAGLAIDTVVDLDDGAARRAAIDHARGAGLEVITGAQLTGTHARRGELAALDVAVGGAAHTLECDGLLMAVGVAPAAGLLVQAGSRLHYDERLSMHLPRDLPPGIFAAGSVNGVFDFAGRVADGRFAATAALATLGSAAAPAPAARPAPAAEPVAHPYPIHAAPAMTAGRDKAFVDFDEDLTTRDLTTAIREGFDSIELLKRYSTLGMGPSQGKVSNVNGIRLLAAARNSTVADIGITTPRPFVQPVPLAALAGRRLRHAARTPLDAWHRAAGAHMKEAGAWLRPMHYGAGEPRARVEAEYRAVRERVGLIDVSTLGKVELFGRDARALLDYAYPCSFTRLEDGMTRYVFMVDGSGTLVDDGVCGRLAADHYYLTTTTTQAAHVVRQLELFAAQLDLDVAIVDRTQACGALNLAGPAARAVLAPLTDLALGHADFPYLALREGEVAGVAARVMRVGFVGELGYEIHVAASALWHVWESLLAAGEGHGIAPFGVDAQRLLRLEKGHCIVGQDTDGTTNPHEIGLGRALRRDGSRFLGRHALGLLAGRTARTLVGFTAPLDAAAELAECLLVIDGQRIAGRLTSVAPSPLLERTVGLAMVESRLAAPGTQLAVRLAAGGTRLVEVCALPFHDPGNTRQNAGDAALPTAARGDGPPALARRSPALAILGDSGLEVDERAGLRIAARARHGTDTKTYLADLSALRRRLVVGRGAADWLRRHGAPVPSGVQDSLAWGDGGLVVRSHLDQYLVIDAVRPLDTALFDAPDGRDGDTLVLSPEMAEFALGGTARRTLVEEFCATPLALDGPFWAQVRFAHCNAALWQFAGHEPHTRILCASADAPFLFEVLRDALGADGTVIGFDDYLARVTTAG
ncbi:MAG: 2Fe-2S iron-sulfur cluster-binding protein [Gammaproteobacteria bacterium]